MSRAKRRQRSTKIRKRIEKRAREEAKLAKKRAKREGGEEEDDSLLRMQVPRGPAEHYVKAVADIDQRLQQEPIRGWTTDDLGGDFGLPWLGRLLDEALQTDPEDPVTVDFLQWPKQELLDRLTALEMAASGLDVEWEPGFAQVMKSLGHAEPPPEEEEEEEEWPPAGAASEDGEEGEGEDDADADEADGDDDD